MAKVEVIEPDSIRIGRFLQENGYKVADPYGEARKHLEDTYVGVGILKPQPPREFLRIFKLKNRGILLGVIEFYVDPHNYDKGPDYWQVSAYGRRNLGEVTTLAEKAAQRFHKRLGVILKDEKEHFESYPWEHPDY